MLIRKIILLVTGIALLTLELHAQATVTSTVIEKENRNAVMIQINQPFDVTVDALGQRMKRSGLSGKTHSDVTSYKAVTLSEIATEKVDIYTKVEKGENKNSSIVYMAVSKGYDNFTNAESDSTITDHVKVFLDAFVKEANAFSLDLMIAAQLDIVNSEEKDYEHLLNDQKDLEKSKADIESNLIDKAKEISGKKESLDRKKEALEELKSKRAELN